MTDALQVLLAGGGEGELLLLLGKITVLLTVAWLAEGALHRANPRWRVVLWRGTALGVLALVAALWVPASVEVPVLPVPPGMEVDADPPVVAAQIAEMETGPRAGTPIPADAPAPPVQSAPPPVMVEQKDAPISLAAIMMGIYMIGVVLIGLRVGLVRNRVGKALRETAYAPESVQGLCSRVAREMDVQTHVPVYLSQSITTPFLTGVLRPRIILPERMVEESYLDELPGIFAHELAHVRGGDLGWSRLVYMVRTALWFHPLAWRMDGAHMAACEEACDAAAAEHSGGADQYSRLLARVAVELVSLPPAHGGIPMARVSEIGRRVKKLRAGVLAARLRGRNVMAAALVCGACLGALAILRPGMAAEEAMTNIVLQPPVGASISGDANVLQAHIKLPPDEKEWRDLRIDVADAEILAFLAIGNFKIPEALEKERPYSQYPYGAILVRESEQSVPMMVKSFLVSAFQSTGALEFCINASPEALEQSEGEFLLLVYDDYSRLTAAIGAEQTVEEEVVGEESEEEVEQEVISDDVKTALEEMAIHLGPGSSLTLIDLELPTDKIWNVYTSTEIRKNETVAFSQLGAAVLLAEYKDQRPYKDLPYRLIVRAGENGTIHPIDAAFTLVTFEEGGPLHVGFNAPVEALKEGRTMSKGKYGLMVGRNTSDLEVGFSRKAPDDENSDVATIKMPRMEGLGYQFQGKHVSRDISIELPDREAWRDLELDTNGKKAVVLTAYGEIALPSEMRDDRPYENLPYGALLLHFPKDANPTILEQTAIRTFETPMEARVRINASEEALAQGTGIYHINFSMGEPNLTMSAQEEETQTSRAPEAATTTQDLIDAVPSGGMVMFENQTEPIEITKGIRLYGGGDGRGKFRFQGDQPAIRINTTEPVLIENIHLQWAPNSSNPFPEAAAIYALDSRNVTIRNCIIEPIDRPMQTPSAVVASGRTHLVFDQGETQGFAYAILYTNGATGVVSHSFLRDAAHSVVTLHEYSQVEIIGNLLGGCDYHAVRNTGGTMNMRDNLVIGNNRAGAYLGNKDAHGEIVNNVFMQNSGSIWGYYGSDVAIRNNLFYKEDGPGVGFWASCDLDIESNVFLENKQALVKYPQPSTDGKGADARGNLYWNNGELKVDFAAEEEGMLEMAPGYADIANMDLTRSDSAPQGVGPENSGSFREMYSRWVDARSAGNGE